MLFSVQDGNLVAPYGLRICGSADVDIDKLELSFIFRLRTSVRVRVGVRVRVSISIYLIDVIKLLIAANGDGRKY